MSQRPALRVDDANLDLADLDNETPDVSVLGKQQVWVMFRFTSDWGRLASPGPFVDDVVIRKAPRHTVLAAEARPRHPETPTRPLPIR